MIVDTHCHLDYIERQDKCSKDLSEPLVASALDRAYSNGLSFLVNPSVTLARIPDVIRLAEVYDAVYAAVAVHPTEVKETLDVPEWVEHIRQYLEHPKVIAVGETGLDYYWDQSFKTLQQQCFKTFLELSVEYRLPVIIHDRDAHDDVLALVDEVPGVFGIMHCFSADVDFALKMIERGFYISFAGNVTFKKAVNLHEAAKLIPLERILVETDSPFLSPVPFRGKPNEPARVMHVVQAIADLRGISYDLVAEQTTRNALKIFNLPLQPDRKPS